MRVKLARDGCGRDKRLKICKRLTEKGIQGSPEGKFSGVVVHFYKARWWRVVEVKGVRYGERVAICLRVGGVSRGSL